MNKSHVFPIKKVQKSEQAFTLYKFNFLTSPEAKVKTLTQTNKSLVTGCAAWHAA